MEKSNFLYEFVTGNIEGLLGRLHIFTSYLLAIVRYVSPYFE